MGDLGTTIATDLSEFLAAEVLAEGTTFDHDSVLSELGVDSFALMELILFVERRYGVVMSMDQLTPEAIRTVRSLSASLAAMVQG